MGKQSLAGYVTSVSIPGRVYNTEISSSLKSLAFQRNGSMTRKQIKLVDQIWYDEANSTVRTGRKVDFSEKKWALSYIFLRYSFQLK